MNGWLPIDKPAGITSTTAVNQLKRVLNAAKAGHAGTLDKPATGVLAVAFGEATKTVSYAMDSRKSYTFTVRFGASTTTDDATGTILETSISRPSDEEIKAAMSHFQGNIHQIPPQYSAVKIDGKRAAAHAAVGKAISLSARPLTVYKLELAGRSSPDRAMFDMECSKGGYVRSIARDLGQSLGCYGHVEELRRTAVGPFALEACAAFSTETDQQDYSALMQRLLPIEAGLSGKQELPCNRETAVKIQYGNSVRLSAASHSSAADAMAWASCEGRAVAIGSVIDGIFHPKRIIRQKWAEMDWH